MARDCRLKFRNKLDESYNNVGRPWFEYIRSKDTIRVHRSPKKKINKRTSHGVAKDLAEAINNVFNEGDAKIGKVAYFSLAPNGFGQVEIRPTQHQWRMFELNDLKKQEAIQKEMDMDVEIAKQEEFAEAERLELERIEQEYRDLGIDINTGESNTMTVGDAHRFPRAVFESIRNRFKELESESAPSILYGEDSPIETVPEASTETVEATSYHSNTQVLFSGKDVERDASKVMENIRGHFRGVDTSIESILDVFYDAMASSDAKVSIVESSELDSPGNLMEYNAETNTILIPRSTLETRPVEDVAYIFMHEVAHSITVGALMNSNTASSKMFNDLMSGLFDKYKELSDSSQYGFTNVAEFVAELASNRDFQNHIKSLEGANRSIWNRFVDYVRTLLGLEKNTDYNKAIKAILEVSEESLSVDGVFPEGHIFARKDVDVLEPKQYDLSTATNKMEMMLDTVLDRLDRSIYEYDKLSRTSEEGKSDNFKVFRDKVSEISKEIEDLYETDQLLAISKFTDYSRSQISFIEKELNKIDLDRDSALNLVSLFRDILGSYSVIPDLTRFINSIEGREGSVFDLDDLQALGDSLNDITRDFNKVGDKILSFEKRLLYSELRRPEYNTEVYKEWYTRLSNEYRGPESEKEAWIREQMATTHKEAIKTDINIRVANLIENIGDDISRTTALLVSADNTNSKLIQNLKQLLERSNDSLIEANRELDFRLKDLHDKVIRAKGRGKSPAEMYKNIITEDSDGNKYLVGEYKIEYINELNRLERAAEESREREGIDPDKPTKEEIELRDWLKENTTLGVIRSGERSRIPKKKWENPNYPPSGIDKEILEAAEEVFRKSDKQKFGIQSLIYERHGAEFIKLPTVTKDFMERIQGGEGRGILTDFARDLSRYRADEVGFEERKFDRDNKPVTEVKVHYRGKLDDPSSQSLDLLTLMALEGKNGNSFSIKNEIENTAHLFLQIAKNKEYFQTNGDKYILNAFSKRNRFATKPGETSNTYARINDMLETHLYDIFRKSMGHISGFDTNKLIDFATAWTAHLGMNVNTVGSAVNLLNGEMHLVLEAVGGYHVGFKNISKAKAAYMRDSVNIMRDSYSPVKTSFVNQVMEMFDTEGNRGMAHDHRFSRSDFMRSHLNMGTLMTLQTSGEHFVQGSMTMAFLDKIKVLNKDSKYIDKDGNVVSDVKKAASMLDMLKRDDKGKVYIDDNVVFTTHTPYLSLKDGGKEILNRFIRKKMKDTVGNYDPKDQGMLYKTGAGRLLLLFRRYLVPMFIAKYRGFNSVHKSLEDLSEKDKFFSEALQEYEMGSYTAAARVVVRGIINMIQEQKISALKTELSNMSEYQKRQARKGAMELLTLTVVLPTLSGLAASFADSNSDDDDSFLWYAASVMVRLQTEMQSFVDPAANWRILKSPTAAMNVFDNSASLILKLFQPWNWSEEYDTGVHAGKNKMFINTQRITPVINRTTLDYKSKYDMLKSGTYHIGGPDRE